MKAKAIVVNESEITGEPDVCGEALDLITSEVSGSSHLSIATIFVDEGKSSVSHYHKKTEEIYYIVQGTGKVVIDGVHFEVRPGTAVYIPIGSIHQIENVGSFSYFSSDEHFIRNYGL